MLTSLAAQHEKSPQRQATAIVPFPVFFILAFENGVVSYLQLPIIFFHFFLVEYL